MAESKIEKLTNQLLDQVNKLVDDRLEAKETLLECERARAVGILSKNILYSTSLSLEAKKLERSGRLKLEDLPDVFSDSER